MNQVAVKNFYECKSSKKVQIIFNLRELGTHKLTSESFVATIENDLPSTLWQVLECKIRASSKTTKF